MMSAFIFSKPNFLSLIGMKSVASATSSVVGFQRWTHGSNHPQVRKTIDISSYEPSRIRNFCIIAHVDHGKSTLADRLLELTGSIKASKNNKQILDRLQVEQERGITIKAQGASLFYNYQGVEYLLNLIDTPGHVDFNYEVQRSLMACQGVILLVDANEGVQAQTVANFHLAFDMDLPLIAIINKIDLKNAKPEIVMKQLYNVFGISENEILKISAKTGYNVEKVLDAIVEQIPCPADSAADAPLQSLLFDSWFDPFQGAITMNAVKQGSVKSGDRILSLQTGRKYEVQEVGILTPEPVPTTQLQTGQVGYIMASMKKAQDALIGDTLCSADRPTEPLPGFRQAQPMVFAGVFPMDQSGYLALEDAISKLTLNDNSVQVNPDNSMALGQGWRLGFLGLLHMDVFEQRLRQEFLMETIITAPNVPYKVKLRGAKLIKQYGGEDITVLNPCHLPPPEAIVEIQEPMVLGTVIVPHEFMGDMISLFTKYRGAQQDQNYIDDTRLIFKVLFPLNEIIISFFDDLKAVTSGYGSFDYEEAGFRPGNLVKMDILINDVLSEELTQIVHHYKAYERGKELCQKLKEHLDREQFEYPIRASVNGRVIARETVKAYRKDVTAKVKSGHDMARKKVLLDRQKLGKKKLKAMGRVLVPKDVFIKVLQR